MTKMSMSFKMLYSNLKCNFCETNECNSHDVSKSDALEINLLVLLTSVPSNISALCSLLKMAKSTACL